MFKQCRSVSEIKICGQLDVYNIVSGALLAVTLATTSFTSAMNGNYLVSQTFLQKRHFRGL